MNSIKSTTCTAMCKVGVVTGSRRGHKSFAVHKTLLSESYLHSCTCLKIGHFFTKHGSNIITSMIQRNNFMDRKQEEVIRVKFINSHSIILPRSIFCKLHAVELS